ncbi:MAG: hypothetical protein HWN67_02245 [Candidatus Helarchaeota archaeon]|nr:hypothetical protein [Candidatus Helarchaeota archaeon]
MPNLDVMLIGMGLSLFSACIFNLAAVLQKREVDKLPELRFDQGVKHIIETLTEFVKNKLWVLAVILGVAGAPFYMISFDMIGITLTQPLQGFGVLVLAIFSVKVLKEPLNSYEKMGIIFLLTAPLFLGLGRIQGQIAIINNYEYFAPVILGLLGIQEKITNINNFGLLLILSIFTIVVFIISVILYLIHFKVNKHHEKIFATLAGIDFAIGAIYLQILVPILGILLGGDYQAFSNYSLLFLIAGFISVAGNFLGIMFIQGAFQKGKAVTVVPFQSTFGTLLPILAGLIIFGQSILQPIFFIVGVISMLIGVISLSRMQE